MKKALNFVALACISVIHQTSMAQMISECMMGRNGMMGGHGKRGHGMMGGTNVSIPEQLPKPRSHEWIKKIDEILPIEENSKKQYQHNSRKYNAHMPCMMIEPQEEDHIKWISQLIHEVWAPFHGGL